MKHLTSLMEKVRRGQGGFTLIELLIVIVILGILAAVVVLNVGGFLGTGTKQAAMVEKDTVQVAILAAMANHGATSMTAIADDGLIDDTPSIELQVGGDDVTVNLKEDTPVLLTGAIQGKYTVNVTGMIIHAMYPAGEPQFEWDPDGWVEVEE